MSLRYLSQLRKDNTLFILQETVLDGKKSIRKLEFNHLVMDGRIKVSASKYLDPKKASYYDVSVGAKGIIMFKELEYENGYIKCEEIDGMCCFILADNDLIHIQPIDETPIDLESEENISDYFMSLLDNKNINFFEGAQTPEEAENKVADKLEEEEKKLEEDIDSILEALNTNDDKPIENMAKKMTEELEIDHALEDFKFNGDS